jgi:hypothetical protein
MHNIYNKNMNIRKDIIEKKQIIEDWIREHRSKLWIAKELKCKIDTLDSYLKKWNIEYKGNMGGKGHKSCKSRISAIDYANKELVQIPKLRKKLIEDGIKEHICEICKLDTWLGQKITLELHHIDGNRYNNSLDNLQMLCPNCHSMTPNHSMKKVYI